MIIPLTDSQAKIIAPLLVSDTTIPMAGFAWKRFNPEKPAEIPTLQMHVFAVKRKNAQRVRKAIGEVKP